MSDQWGFLCLFCVSRKLHTTLPVNYFPWLALSCHPGNVRRTDFLSLGVLTACVTCEKWLYACMFSMLRRKCSTQAFRTHPGLTCRAPIQRSCPNLYYLMTFVNWKANGCFNGSSAIKWIKDFFAFVFCDCDFFDMPEPFMLTWSQWFAIIIFLSLFSEPLTKIRKSTHLYW